MGSIFRSRYTELYVLVFIVLGLLAFWGTSANSQYVQENARIVFQMADTMNSVFAYAGGDISTVSPSPALKSTTIRDSAMVAMGPPDVDYLDSFKADQVIKYTVQSGDTIGSVADNFGVSINTIIWANTLKNPNVLALGQVLSIPPVTGVIHTVQQGETVASIAKKYKADASKILSFNNVSDGQVLLAGNELMVPGGVSPGPIPSVRAAVKGSRGSGIYVSVGDGQCVAFVQAHGFSHMSGNANTWKRFINTPTAISGGVVVLRGGRYGHVALVTAVKADSIQVVEQNYYGPYIVDHREISLGDKSIVGFIQ